MSIFDESSVEAGHMRLASSVSESVEVLKASTDLIRKVVLHESKTRPDLDEHANYFAASMLSCRIVNDVGSATKLIDCGYFAQAASLVRDISECAMLMLYFSEKPEELKQWREAKENRYKIFGRSKLKFRISDKEKFNFLDQYFDTYSEFGTHPSSKSIIAHMIMDKFQIGPHINEKIYNMLYYDLAILVWHVTDICGKAYEAMFHGETDSIFPVETSRYRNAWQFVEKLISTGSQLK